MKRGRNSLSKTKYKEFMRATASIFDVHLTQCATKEVLDHVHTLVLGALCEITRFNPDACTYDKERMDRIKEQTGKTSYELFAKKYNETNKEEVNRKTAERVRRHRAAKLE